MLNRSYNVGIIGYNYISLVYGLIQLSRGKSVLIIDEENINLGEAWYLNLGHVERGILQEIGNKYQIEALIHIDNYLREKNTILFLNEKMVEFTSSPYANVKEMARKLPECFSGIYRNVLIGIEPEKFDKSFFEFLDQICADSFEQFEKGNLDQIYLNIKDSNIDTVFTRFLDYLRAEDFTTKQLHFVLQMMFQTAFSSAYSDVESKYLLASLLSPRYKVDLKSLNEDLLYEFRKNGGDLRYTMVDDWGVDENRLRSILLGSVDGIVRTQNLNYFGEIPYRAPFTSSQENTSFLSIDLECPLTHDFVNVYKNKRIIFSHQDRMGSDFPFWELAINDEGNLKAVYSFANHLGTKPSFYYPQALEDIYQSLEMILPGLLKVDWISRTKLKKGSDTWIEYGPKQKKDLHPHADFKIKTVYSKDTGSLLEAVEYCGPARAKSLGAYSYLLDIFS